MAGGRQGDGTERAESPRDLAFAAFHELGNLLAGARLEAGLLGRDAAPGSAASAAGRIAEIAARAGSLLALLHPLLSPDRMETFATAPAELLDAVRRGLEPPLADRVALDLQGAAGLPDVDVVAEVVHHLLLCEIFYAAESAGPDDVVRVAARDEGDRVAFLVEGRASSPAAPGTEALRGRPLSHAIARELLERQGGALALTHAAGRTRSAFALRAVRG